MFYMTKCKWTENYETYVDFMSIVINVILSNVEFFSCIIHDVWFPENRICQVQLISDCKQAKPQVSQKSMGMEKNAVFIVNKVLITILGSARFALQIWHSVTWAYTFSEPWR